MVVPGALGHRSERRLGLWHGYAKLGSSPSINPVAATGGQALIYRPELAMATIIAIAPVLIVFLFAERTLVTGMLAGAAKE